MLQKTGADSLAGLSGGGHNAFSSKSTSNALSKITIVLALCFIVNSVVIAKVINNSHAGQRSIVDSITAEQQSTPAAPKKLEAPEAAE